MISPGQLYWPILLLASCFILEVDCATQKSAVYALAYNDIGASSFDKCIRIMNGTKQIGCQSELNGNVGILFLINTTTDIDKIIAGENNPYIAFIHADVFDGAAVKRLTTSQKVNGIIVFENDGYTGKTNGWSPEPKCPRYIYGLYSDQYGPQFAKCGTNPWNLVGDELSYYDIPFPVFFMQNKTATEQLLHCYNEHNLDGAYPFCAVQMDARMDGAVSTETCVRRNNNQYNLSPSVYCGEMGGQNILSMLQQPSTSDVPDTRPIILVTAALDSRSFLLESSVPGANSATGFITLLSVAKILGNLTQEQKQAMTHRVMFVLYDGEAFDNTGSTRVVYDMARNAFPISPDSSRLRPESIDLSKVDYIIEIGQIGHVRELAWVHYDPISNHSATVSNIVNTLQEQSSGLSIEFRKSSQNLGLPPSSLQSVLKEKDRAGVLITDFDQNYANKYYLSTYDTPDKLGVEYNDSMTESEIVLKLDPLAKRMAEISDAISRTVYKLGSGKNLTNPNSDTYDIANTLYCYMFNGSCSFFWLHADASISQKAFNAIMTRYVSVYNSEVLSQATYFARNLFLWYTGEQVHVNASTPCESSKNDDRYLYLAFNRNSTVCIRAPVYLTDGRSPASIINNYDYVQGKYPAWSESQWKRNAFRLTVFTVQDPFSQGMVLLTGLLFFFFALGFVIFIKKKSDTLFDPVDVL